VSFLQRRAYLRFELNSTLRKKGKKKTKTKEKQKKVYNVISAKIKNWEEGIALYARSRRETSSLNLTPVSSCSRSNSNPAKKK
jgi:Holliday junction resolvase RusA-like endonuclease